MAGPGSSALKSEWLTFLLRSVCLLLVLCNPASSRCSSSCSPASSADRLRRLGSLRDTLIRFEDTIVFCLIERSKYGYNHHLYDSDSDSDSDCLPSFIHDSEIVQAKAGRYMFEEENPFSECKLPCSLHPPPPNCTKVLHHPASSFDVNDQVFVAYRDLLPKITSSDLKGDDESYVPILATDLTCLQALSTRIHIGKFVAEAKYNTTPEAYDQLIRKKDTNTLMNMLTDKKVEEAVVRRVDKKAMAFGQDIDLNNTSVGTNTYKVNSSVVSQFYRDSVIPLTKNVEIQYLLHRLD